MIRPSYALKLARTKLRSKRGMLAASVIVASLLFAVLIATIIVFTGAEKSAQRFIEKAGNNKLSCQNGTKYTAGENTLFAEAIACRSS